MVGREGFEPPKAEPADLQSAPFDRFGTDPWALIREKQSSKRILYWQRKNDCPGDKALLPYSGTHATLAQLVEQLFCKQRVVGSSPSGGSSLVFTFNARLVSLS